MTQFIRTAFLVLVLFALCCSAQTAPASPDLAAPLTNVAGVQVGLSPTSHITAGINWGHHVTGTLWTFTRVDVVGFSRNPLQAQTILTLGACDIPHSFFHNHLMLGWCLDGGMAETNDGTAVHIGNALGTDGLAFWRFGKDGHFGAGVMGGWVQTNLTPAKASAGSNSAITPVRAVLEYNF